MWTASARRQYRRSERRYASDVSDVSNAEFALIAPMLPAPKHGGRARTTSLREVLNAILYLLRSGCGRCAYPSIPTCRCRWWWSEASASSR